MSRPVIVRFNRKGGTIDLEISPHDWFKSDEADVAAFPVFMNSRITAEIRSMAEEWPRPGCRDVYRPKSMILCLTIEL